MICDDVCKLVSEAPAAHGIFDPPQETMTEVFCQVESVSRTEFWRAAKFTLFSASAGLIQIGSFTLMNEVMRWPYWVCYLTALVLSVLWNFTLNRKFTFKSAANVPVAMLKVAAYYAVFTPTSTLLGNWLVRDVGWNEYVVTILNMLINFSTEFLYQRFYVFGKSVDTAKPRK